MINVAKYEFNSKEQADSKIEALGEGHNHAIVKLGNIVLQQAELDEDGEVVTEAVLSSKFHVDVMWIGLDSHPYGWATYAVDLDSNGVHSFLGVDYIINKI